MELKIGERRIVLDENSTTVTWFNDGLNQEGGITAQCTLPTPLAAQMMALSYAIEAVAILHNRPGDSEGVKATYGNITDYLNDFKPENF